MGRPSRQVTAQRAILAACVSLAACAAESTEPVRAKAERRLLRVDSKTCFVRYPPDFDAIVNCAAVCRPGAEAQLCVQGSLANEFVEPVAARDWRRTRDTGVATCINEGLVRSSTVWRFFYASLKEDMDRDCEKTAAPRQARARPRRAKAPRLTWPGWLRR